MSVETVHFTPLWVSTYTATVKEMQPYGLKLIAVEEKMVTFHSCQLAWIISRLTASSWLMSHVASFSSR